GLREQTNDTGFLMLVKIMHYLLHVILRVKPEKYHNKNIFMRCFASLNMTLGLLYVFVHVCSVGREVGWVKRKLTHHYILSMVGIFHFAHPTNLSI
ncbi:MAG: hypothetical protein II085_01290, partial [Alphaproteobacteria bacterium]|nr:hypothetical protein [Alphaproteobacteria bacterium]